MNSLFFITFTSTYYKDYFNHCHCTLLFLNFTQKAIDFESIFRWNTLWVRIAFKTFWIKMAKIVQISALIFSILTDFSPASTKGTIFEKRKTDGKQTNWHFVIVQLKMCIGNIYPHYIVSYFFHITYTFIFPQMQCTHQLKKFLHILYRSCRPN